MMHLFANLNLNNVYYDEYVMDIKASGGSQDDVEATNSTNDCGFFVWIKLNHIQWKGKYLPNHYTRHNIGY